MNRIQEVAEKTAAGHVIEGVDQCLMLMRDCDSGCDWSGVAPFTDPTTGRDITADDRFAAADLTRLVTSTAVLVACDLSLLGLDKSVANYLSPDLVERLNTTDGQTRGGDITVRNLLNRASVVDHEAPARPDTGLALAGMILEDVMGMELHDVYREFVFEPLGMTSTSLEASPEPATCGLMTTAADLASLMNGLSGGSFISPDSWAEMTSWREDPAEEYDSYGLGMGRYRIGDLDVIGHRGKAGEFVFWLPFDVAIAGTVNAEDVDHRLLLEATIQALCTA